MGNRGVTAKRAALHLPCRPRGGDAAATCALLSNWGQILSSFLNSRLKTLISWHLSKTLLRVDEHFLLTACENDRADIEILYFFIYLFLVN